ncbi:ATP-binding protein [Streptomyces violaceusniger]|uniref:ATP-binding protein n=1 Tax=Streptomyces violaceusniger TaxID=68280 RepID=UPI00341811BD
MTTPNPPQPVTRQWKMQFTSTPRCVRLVRSQVCKTLRNWDYGQEDADRMVLVCSELATNAVQHGHKRGHLFEVRLTDEGTSCLVEVSDAAGRRLPRRVEADESDEHGRGLQLVAALAKETGHHPRSPIGKTVWARLVLDTSGEGTDA